MPIKLVHIIPTLDQGGAEKQLCLLCEHLDRREFDVQVIVLTHSGPREASLRAAGVPIHSINKRGKFDPAAYSRLKRLLVDLQPDVVHTWLFAANSYGRMAARAAKVPVILAGERCVDPWKSWWQIAIDRQLLKSTSTVVTNTSAVTEFYRSRGLPVDKFTVIPNAVEPPPVNRITKAEAFQRLGIEPRSKLVLAIGRLWPQKGYQDLVWAGELMYVGYDDVWFVIIGDGPERGRLQHFRDQVRAESSVRFAGERSDARELLSAADLLWNGSLYEGQSNTILEAMALGVPVVATDIPGNRDLIDNETTGYLYRLGDVSNLTRHSIHLLSHPEIAAQFGNAAAEKARTQFSIAQMVEKHSELYQRLCSTGGVGSVRR